MLSRFFGWDGSHSRNRTHAANLKI